MRTINFKLFINNVIMEALHPELQDIAKSTPIPPGYGYTNMRTGNAGKRISKQALIANKIKELVERGERTGIEGNMPKGSSRAYLQEDEPKNIMLDGKPAQIKAGTKVAIRSALDPYHFPGNHDGLFLGALQNKAENDDYYVNSRHRILTEDYDKPGHYDTNESHGIFPPLFDHDDKNYEYTQVGHCRNITSKEFPELTRTPDFPSGITHRQFYAALERDHAKELGRYWEQSPETEKQFDVLERHPLIQKFLDYHRNTGNPPYDLSQMANMGVFEHPNGTKHIVARDHGFSSEVEHAYSMARKNREYR